MGKKLNSYYSYYSSDRWLLEYIKYIAWARCWITPYWKNTVTHRYRGTQIRIGRFQITYFTHKHERMKTQ